MTTDDPILKARDRLIAAACAYAEIEDVVVRRPNLADSVKDVRASDEQALKAAAKYYLKEVLAYRPKAEGIES